jgi:hypothetical protein
MNEKFDIDLEEISRKWNEAMNQVEQDSEAYWNSLTKDQQLQVFCAVSRRIFKGELEDKGSYRWVLYDVFGFGPEAYAPAQLAGYLAIHNAIFTGDEVDDAVAKVVNKCIEICEAGQATQTTAGGAAQQIREWFRGTV